MAEKKPAWPSVEEQLAEAKVIHGSALEKLIRENQDVSLLRPEEAHDKRHLPPWLRIYWRKQHPNAIYTGPSGGYPLVLEKLYDWMTEHQDLPGYGIPDSPRDPNAGGQHGK